MIWQNPWAWAGLLALGLPILIHLLGRGHAKVQPFPTLRFLQLSRLLPTRRTRIQDPLLLLIRLGVLLAAVAAIAQPLFLTADRKRSLDAALARAIIVDTSVSMSRTGAAPDTGIMAAQHEAERLSAEAATATTLQTAAPAAAIAGALAWLQRHSGRAELVIISDFQRGTLDSLDLSVVPAAVGIVLHRVPSDTVNRSVAPLSALGNSGIAARITAGPDQTSVTWEPHLADPWDGPLLLAKSDASARLDAAREAARSVAVPLPVFSDRPIAIIYPDDEQRADLLRTAVAPTQSWMTESMTDLADDELLASVTGDAVVMGDTAHTPGLVLMRNDRGQPVVFAMSGTLAGKERLLLFSQADAGSLTSAGLIAATRRSLSHAAPLTELEPERLAETTLQRWERPAATDAVMAANAEPGTASDGRWFWGLALLFLGIEWLVRRRPRLSASAYDQPV